MYRQMTDRATKDKAELRRLLEEERKKLNDSLAGGLPPEKCLEISQRLDKLIEQYIESP